MRHKIIRLGSVSRGGRDGRSSAYLARKAHGEGVGSRSPYGLPARPHSVRQATIAAVHKLDPDLPETDCELVAMIVEEATETALFVAFDVREP
jgi:hypothetical protein